MATECIDTFEMCGRQFSVLWKPSATYLHADGHMWGESLGEDLDQQEAIEQAKMRAVMMLINEREQEEGLVHRLYGSPMTDEVEALAKDYVLFTASLPMKPGSIVPVQADVVYAPFNQNTYLCTMKGWQYVGSYPSQDEVTAALAPWCEAQQAHPCREVHRKCLADVIRSAAAGEADTKLTRSQRIWASVRTEFFALVYLAIPVGLCWAWYRAVNAWPWFLAVSCALMFLGCCIALWVQRRKKKRLQTGESGSP